MMVRILIIGGSRGIGKATTQLALQAGHEVTVLARHPEKLGITDDNLRLVTSDVLNLNEVSEATKGQQVVICTLGLPTREAIGPPVAQRSYVLSAGTANLLQAMQTQGVKRLLVITAIGTGDSSKHCTPLTRLTLRYGLRWLFKEKDRQEELIRSSGLDWTILRPTALTNGKARGAVATQQPPRSGLLTHVSRADVAQALLDATEDKTTSKKVLYISYPPHFGDSIRWILGYFGHG